MLNPFADFANNIAAVAGGSVSWAGDLFDNRSESRELADRARTAREGAAQQWDGDRTTHNVEWDRLSADFDGTYAGTTVQHEAFKTWGHKEIYDALNTVTAEHDAVNSADINAGSEGWRTLATGIADSLKVFNDSITTDIGEQWTGQTANAALAATQTFVTEAQKLPSSFTLVANGIDLLEGFLAQAKMAIIPPVETSGFDDFVGHIPGNGVLKAAAHRANEAEALAQDFMNDFYQPGVAAVDERTPVLPVTANPVDTGRDEPENKPYIPPGGDDPYVPPGTKGEDGEVPGDTPGTDDPGVQEQSTDPGVTDPSGTSSTSGTGTQDTGTTSPAGTGYTDPSTQTSAAGTSGSTGSGYPGSSGSTGGSTGGTGSTGGGAGQTVSGSPGSGSGTSSTGGSSGTSGSSGSGRGMTGMPGMGGMGNRGRQGGDDETHQSPDYLHYERESELIGNLPPALPPGGVIGG